MFKHKSSIKGILVPLSALIVAGCASLNVQTDFNPQASFSPLRTYAWLTHAGDDTREPAVNSPLVASRIRHAVDSTLESTGFEKTTNDNPDFRIAYNIFTENRARFDPSYGYSRFDYFGWRFGHRRYRYGYFGVAPVYGRGRSYEYLETTLVIDIVDARTDETIWRGWARKSLNRNPSSEDVRKYVSEAVTEILEELPTRLTGNLVADGDDGKGN